MNIGFRFLNQNLYPLPYSTLIQFGEFFWIFLLPCLVVSVHIFSTGPKVQLSEFKKAKFWDPMSQANLVLFLFLFQNQKSQP